MRYLFRLVVALALAALPLRVSAQLSEEGATSEPNLQEPAPNAAEPAQSAEPTQSLLERWQPDAFVDPTKPKPSSEPSLELGLDSAGLQMTPTAPRTAEELRLQELDDGVRRSRAGLIGSAVVVAVGAAIIAGGVVANKKPPEPSSGDFDIDLDLGPAIAFTFGSLFVLGGVVGIAISGSRLNSRKAELRELQEAHYGKPRRVQWDLARSRLVF